MADVRDASCPPLLALRDWFWNESQATACHGVTGPSVVRLDATGNVPAAVRSRSRWVPLPAATVSPFRSRVLLAVSAGPTASKQLHVTWANVEEWRSIATGDESRVRLPNR